MRPVHLVFRSRESATQPWQTTSYERMLQAASNAHRCVVPSFIHTLDPMDDMLRDDGGRWVVDKTNECNDVDGPDLFNYIVVRLLRTGINHMTSVVGIVDTPTTVEFWTDSSNEWVIFQLPRVFSALVEDFHAATGARGAASDVLMCFTFNRLIPRVAAVIAAEEWSTSGITKAFMGSDSDQSSRPHHEDDPGQNHLCWWGSSQGDCSIVLNQSVSNSNMVVSS